MPSGSGGGSQVVQKSNTDPWTGVQPGLKYVGEEAARLYGSGVGPSYYPGATYVGPTTQELAGQQKIQDTALNGSGLSQGLLNNQGVLSDIASGKNNIGGLGANTLSDIASGKNNIDSYGVGKNNPYLMKSLDYSADKAKDAVNSTFSGLGRYAAPEHGGTLGREIGNLYSTGLRDQMNQDMNREMQIQGTNIGNQMGAANAYNSMQGANISNQAGAANSYAQLAPGAEDSRYWDANKLIGVGAAQRGELQTELQSNIDRYNAQQSRPWDQLNMYNNVLSGLGGMGSSQTTTVPRGSAFSGLLGGGLAGAGLGSQFGGLGTLLGGGLGGLAGLFM